MKEIKKSILATSKSLVRAVNDDSYSHGDLASAVNTAIDLLKIDLEKIVSERNTMSETVKEYFKNPKA